MTQQLVIRDNEIEPTLSNDEIVDLLNKWKAGDKEAGNKICKSMIGLAAFLSKRWKASKPYLPLDEIFSCALEAMLDAMRNYDKNKGAKFSTYYGTWVKCHVLNISTRIVNFKGRGKIRKDILNTAVNKINKRDRFVIDRRFFGDEKESFESIGKKLGITRERVRQLEVRALERLKKLLTKKIEEAA